MNRLKNNGTDQDIAHHLNWIHRCMWMINKTAHCLKDVDNRDLQEALNAFQAMAHDQNEKIIVL